jgi:glycerophosphoryl diester phosphodiesterase
VLRYVFAAGVLVALAVAVAAVMADVTAVEREVGVTAHRGSSRDAPENTLSAIRSAIGHRADYAEIDVQEIADGRIVLFHDTDFLRVARSARKIWEVEFEEARGFDVGRWFSPEFEGERVPTLEEAIEEARGRIGLNIELKHHGRERSLVRSVVRIVREARFEEDCLLTSLDLEAVLEAKRLEPALRCGYITAEYVGDPTALDVDVLSVRAKRATKALVRRARRRGKEVHAWTVNDAATMERLVDIGVDNIITDDPALARRVIEEREGLSQQEKVLLAVRHWWWRR